MMKRPTVLIVLAFFAVYCATAVADRFFIAVFAFDAAAFGALAGYRMGAAR